MCEFITELRTYNEKDYPPNSVKELIVAIQMYLMKHKVLWKLLDDTDDKFMDLYTIVDNMMKQRVAMGLGVIKSATPISCNIEEDLWSSDVLGEHCPKQLSDTIMYLLAVNLALRGGLEHKNLRCPGFNPQIVVSKDSDGVDV